MEDKKLSKYYGEIAEKLDEMIPVEWDNIILYAEETGDVSSASFYYNEKNSKEYCYNSSIPRRYNVSQQIYKQLWRELISINKKLQLEFKDNEQNKWYSFTFCLDSNWKFKIKYEYKRNSQIGQLERRIRWAYDELGIIPEDEYEKELLEEYLKEQGKSL